MGRNKSGKTDEEFYEEKKDRDNTRNLRQSATARDKGPLPEVQKPRRRSRCKKSFRLFCETYLRERFYLAWSPDHLRILTRFERCILSGGQFALAMPRAAGKTALTESAALWALLYAFRTFVVMIGSTEEAAEELLDSVKVQLETNDLLLADFPEVCYPIRCLEGIANRCKGQTIDGIRTRITWTDRELVLPTIKSQKRGQILTPTSGSLIRVAGITGRVRGMTASTADGRKIRPDLAIIDDPQTDQSAVSPSQNNHREKVLSRAVLGLAGPGQKIAAVMPCTVIAPGDLADRSLDRERHPEWQGERTKLLYAFPTNEVLWEEYNRVRIQGLRAKDEGKTAREFYLANRVTLDEGAVVAWPERFNSDEASAVQHAMNLYLADPLAFAAEYQNEPQAETIGSDLEELQPDTLAAKINRLPFRIVPREATRLTAGIDIQQKVLYYVVCAWDEHFGGAIIDYGAWPRQNRTYFRASDARPSFAEVFPNIAQTGQIYAALSALAGEILGAVYQRDGSEDTLRVERCLIDANWGISTDTVYQWCRHQQGNPWASAVLPSHGHGIGASGRPMSEWPVRAGETRGRDWVKGPSPQGKGVRVTWDANSWKSFLAERLRTPGGSPGCLWLPGSQSWEHQLLADHLCSEYRVVTQGRGRRVEEWKVRPDRSENHWWDCGVMCAVGASTLGLRYSAAEAAGGQEPPPRTKQRKKWGEMQRSKRGG